jgi:SAM-dependent methyltransferase
MRELTWKDDDRLALGETTFHTMPPDFLTEGARVDVGKGEFFIFKPRSRVEEYAALIEEVEPQHVFELGVYQGGSTLFFAELARPQRIVAIDRLPLTDVRDRMARYAASRGLTDVVRVFGEVDQADRHRLAQIVEHEFDGAPLDLVVDDCSHLYEATRASFNELFPRLRPGGVYVIEDWRLAHSALGEWLPEQVPLSRLLFEIVLALAGMPDLITEVSIDKGAASITRGETRVDPATFQISACSDPRGQALLAPA